MTALTITEMAIFTSFEKYFFISKLLKYLDYLSFFPFLKETIYASLK